MRAFGPARTFVVSNKTNTTMQTDKLPMWAKLIGYLFGMSLLFIGGRFLLAPEVAERGFGLIYDQPSESFHWIKGIRDLYSGLLLTLFTAFNWRKPLAVAVLAGSVVPITDMQIVLGAPNAVAGAEWIHGTTAVALWVFGYFLLRNNGRVDAQRNV